ncbi:MAG: hypothetical protein KC435_03205 [Thermomicrobiales bacterium]|nr:hypothetical protein [Thermomicrobiales bacterium]
MRRVLHLIVLLGMFAAGFSWPSVVAQTSVTPVDLADVPLPIQALPEFGYQVLTGAYLDASDAVRFVADARGLDRESVSADVEALNRTYVLDLVLPVDRADENGAFLAVIQTVVYELDADTDTTAFVDMLGNYDNLKYVETRASSVDGAISVTMIGEGGDMIRSLVASGNVVVEVISMDATGEPDATEHDLVVEATLARLQQLQTAGDPGLSTSALTVASSIDFANANGTGLHGLYRVRDGEIQPALGELGTEDQTTADGLTSSWYGSSLTAWGSGTGIAYTSVWLSSYDDEATAGAALDAIVTGDGSAFDDPYFLITSGESGTWKSDAMLSVHGTINGDAYSGYIQVAQQGDVIVVIGLRVVGSALPSSSIVEQMMSTQLSCLESGSVCETFTLPEATPIPATPLADRGNTFSSQFGWMLPTLDPDWQVTDEMTESGYDMVQLQNGQSQITLESVVNHHGEPVQCVLDELHNLQEFEEHSDIRLWKDSAGNTEAGNESGHAWSTYRVEPLADERADQEYVIRIDCYSLVTSGANLVMTQIAPVDSWESERVKGDEIRDTIAFPINSVQHGRIALSTHDWRIAMIYFPWIEPAA